MLRTSLLLVMQLSIDIANNKFGKVNYDKDEAKILLVSSAFKKSTGLDYLTSGAKKDDQAAKKGG